MEMSRKISHSEENVSLHGSSRVLAVGVVGSAAGGAVGESLRQHLPLSPFHSRWPLLT